MPFSPALWLAAVSALLLAAAASPAEAAPDKTLGMALLGAHVTRDALVLHSAGVKSVEKLNPGNYRVTFERSVFGCIPVATVANEGSGRLIINPNQSTPGPNPEALSVRTFEVDGTLADKGFTLTVFCAR